jgi:sirohydrochlorin ferrochelatase
MNALLLVAHGSRSPESNDEIVKLTSSLRALIERAPDRSFEIVQYAFLELVEPDIDAGISALVEQGADKVTLLPYFLAKGNHVNRDIPEIISAAQSRFPDLRIDLIPHIGYADNMCKLLVEHLQINTG